MGSRIGTVTLVSLAFFALYGCETPRQKEARITYTRAVADTASKAAVEQVVGQIQDINSKMVRLQAQVATQMDTLKAMVISVAATGRAPDPTIANTLNSMLENQRNIVAEVKQTTSTIQGEFRKEIADSMDVVRAGMAELRKRDQEIITGVSKTLASVYPHIFKGKMETSGKWRWNWYWYETVKAPLLEPTQAELQTGYPEKRE